MIHQHTERREGQWVPQDPSMAQLRQLVTEYCILPVGSQQVSTKSNPRQELTAAQTKKPRPLAGFAYVFHCSKRCRVCLRTFPPPRRHRITRSFGVGCRRYPRRVKEATLDSTRYEILTANYFWQKYYKERSKDILQIVVMMVLLNAGA